ncbi:MAG TPA: EAL domain-containing protein [Rhizomicrobium sp.]|jgi:cyclic-di-GMP phosphodiesterase TipF (flagellum assembly factor)
MTRFLITLTCFFVCATFGAAMALFSGWPIGILSGALAFLFTQQMTSSFSRRRDKRAAAREIATLRQMTLEFEGALASARHRMDELTQQLEARSDAQGKKIVSELQMLEGLMREFASRVSKSARAAQDEIGPAQTMQTGRRQGGVAQYLASMGESELLEVIRASLEENRVDLYLQPIVSLPQRKLRFYEALSRLRAEDGSVIMPAQYIKVASPAGLMSVVDNLLLFRCVQIVRRLTQKSKDIAIFCNISGDTLADAEFFPQFLDYMQANRDLAGQIVFEFAQNAVLEAGNAGAENLSRLAGLGFALSMDHVETLALDFVRLKTMGFRHLKVRADMLTNGMNGAGAAVAAEDFKKLLSRHGLNLIVERVEDEKTVVQLLDYAVDYAQGFLFGEPRAVREDPIRAQADAASIVPLKRAS